MEILKLLKLVQFTLNSIPNATVNHPDAKTSYNVASLVDKHVASLEPKDVSYKVWIHVERLEDPDSENEKYTDIGFPVQLAHVRHLVHAENLVELIEEVYGGEIDNI